MSEVAQIRKRIEQDIEAMRQAQTYACVARHDVIARRYEHLAGCFERLAADIGFTAAIAEIARAMEEKL